MDPNTLMAIAAINCVICLLVPNKKDKYFFLTMSLFWFVLALTVGSKE